MKFTGPNRLQETIHSEIVYRPLYREMDIFDFRTNIQFRMDYFGKTRNNSLNKLLRIINSNFSRNYSFEIQILTFQYIIATHQERI